MGRTALITGLFLIAGGLVASLQVGRSQQTLPVRVQRWLAIRTIQGETTYLQNQTARPAQPGDRLQAIGDGVVTGKNASIVLEVDTGIGFINVAEQTRLQVRSLSYAPDNGRITRLQVTQGRVQLRLRRFTHQGSQLEIRTPAGLSGVRGTDYGLTIQPNGSTGVATLSGKVLFSAQGQTVAVNRGSQTLTLPGEPPASPTPLRNDPRLWYEFQRLTEGNVRQVRLVGQTDPVNLVVVNDTAVQLDRQGRFSNVFYVPSYLQVKITVTTPLGKRQFYDLALP